MYDMDPITGSKVKALVLAVNRRRISNRDRREHMVVPLEHDLDSCQLKWSSIPKSLKTGYFWTPSVLVILGTCREPD